MIETAIEIINNCRIAIEHGGAPFVKLNKLDIDTIHAEIAELQKEIDQNLELWDADIADHNKTIWDLASYLRIIAGEVQCIDNLMGNIDIAKHALKNNANQIAEAVNPEKAK